MEEAMERSRRKRLERIRMRYGCSGARSLWMASLILPVNSVRSARAAVNSNSLFRVKVAFRA